MPHAKVVLYSDKSDPISCDMRTAAAAAEEEEDEDVDESLTEPPLGKQMEPCEAIEADMPSFMPSHCTRFFPRSSSSGSSSPLAGSSTTITLFSADSGLAGVADDGTGRLQFARFQGRTPLSLSLLS